MTALPESVLQFGGGRFLRAFADLFISHANAAGQGVGRVVIVQSTGDERAGILNQQAGRYHVCVRGLENGAVVDRVEACTSVARGLVASAEWPAVLELARSPALKWVLSNTTESGYALDPADRPGDAPPRSFPAKLLAVLRERFHAGGTPLVLIPCELREDNADVLRGLVVQLAESWGEPAEFVAWVRDRCAWLNTLVDRIVVNPPADHPLKATDGLLCMAEPFAFWALQEKPGVPRLLEHPAVRHTPDVKPYFLRKVRILNAAHTALLVKAWPRGFRTVRAAVQDADLGPWLERLLFDEIVPTLAGRVEGPEEFARQTLERFRNPFLEHQLADIATHHAAKVQVRLMPTATEFRVKFGKEPPLLAEVLAQPTAF
jgi:tagaturonate reductase